MSRGPFHFHPPFHPDPSLSSETQLLKAKGGEQERHALNHIYKDLVSIVITQSTEKGCVTGEGVCVCVCKRACVDWSVHICVYPYGKKRKGIIFRIAPGPVCVHVQMCACVCFWRWVAAPSSYNEDKRWALH